jgi:hypothetical protein
VAYLLLNTANTEPRHKSGAARPGDILVSDDFRTAYTVAKDGSRRRIKDKAEAKIHIDHCRFMLAQRALEEEREALKRAEAARDIVVHPDQDANPAHVGSMLALLAGGLTLGAPLEIPGA